MCSKANMLTPQAVLKEKYSVYLQGATQDILWLVLRWPEFFHGFQGRVFIGSIWREVGFSPD